MLPKYADVELPLLRELVRRGGAAKPRDLDAQGRTVYEALADEFDLSESDRKEVTSDSEVRPKWENMVRWARQKLLDRELLDGTQHGVWLVSDDGVAFLRSDQEAQAEAAAVPNDAGWFGDPEHNRRVEVAAVGAVKKWYIDNGWRVQSVESENCGFDLLCRKGDLEENAEVKGSSGAAQDCIITAGEVNQARNNPKSIVWVVTSALSECPELNRYSGKEFIAAFALAPLQYRASRRP